MTVQTTSSHLKKLEQAGLIRQRKQGRHRYFGLADADVGNVLESMMGLAQKTGMLRTQTGPRDAALRKARVCYNHLAGEFGVQLYDRLVVAGHLLEHDEEVELTSTGRVFSENFGIDMEALEKARRRRPMCKSCLDWSSRRNHLAGALGTAFLEKFYELNWAKRIDGSRVVAFSPNGERQFQSLLRTLSM